MTTSRFQLVGSLLRPANLGEFKRQIEAREDIKYPFYDDFDGYKETEASLIQKIVAEQKENGLDIVTDGEFGSFNVAPRFSLGLRRYRALHC